MERSPWVCLIAARAGAWLIAAPFVGGCVPIRVPDAAVRYIAFGDSTTSDAAAAGYAEILRRRLGEPPEAFAHEGVSGETTAEGLVRLEGLLSGGLYPNAEVLLYWEGGNDIADFIEAYDPLLMSSPNDPEYPYGEALDGQLAATQANVESAVVMARRAGLDVYVATMYLLREGVDACDALPLALILPVQAQHANAYIERLNARIRTGAAAWGAAIVDVAARDDVLRANADNYADCNHLSGEGNAIVADVFFEAITKSSD